jgi:hypothetical protein
VHSFWAFLIGQLDIATGANVFSGALPG